MLTELCQFLRNWFVLNKYYGTFIIDENGVLRHENGDPCDDILKRGQYFRIIGSMNDGVYQFRDEGLPEQEFEGAIWAMAVPPTVIALAAEIGAWVSSNQAQLDSPYNSESFGGYTYSKAVSGQYGAGATWQDHFSARLNPWRKL